MIKGTEKLRKCAIILVFVLLLSFTQATFCVGDINEAKDNLGNIQDQLKKIENEIKQKQSIKSYYESLAKNMKDAGRNSCPSSAITSSPTSSIPA